MVCVARVDSEVLTHNCNHFSNKVSKFLLNQNIPDHVPATVPGARPSAAPRVDRPNGPRWVDGGQGGGSMASWTRLSDNLVRANGAVPPPPSGTHPSSMSSAAAAASTQDPGEMEAEGAAVKDAGEVNTAQLEGETKEDDKEENDDDVKEKQDEEDKEKDEEDEEEKGDAQSSEEEDLVE